MKYVSKKLFLIPLFALILSAAAFPFLPDQIPIHFDIAGNPDNYSGRVFVFMMPVLCFGLLALAEVMPHIDPRQMSYEKFGKHYQSLHILVQLLLMVVQIITITVALGYSIQIQTVVPLMVGLLLSFCGNMMPKFKQNFFCGIRTPWTIQDEDVWFRTHRVTGRLWMVCGLLIACTGILPEGLRLVLFFPALALMVLFPYGYSCWIYKQKNQ